VHLNWNCNWFRKFKYYENVLKHLESFFFLIFISTTSSFCDLARRWSELFNLWPGKNQLTLNSNYATIVLILMCHICLKQKHFCCRCYEILPRRSCWLCNTYSNKKNSYRQWVSFRTNKRWNSIAAIGKWKIIIVLLHDQHVEFYILTVISDFALWIRNLMQWMIH